MTIVGIPAVLDDDVGVRFKNRNHLLVSRNTFTLDNTPVGLVVDLSGQISVMFDSVEQRKPSDACRTELFQKRLGFDGLTDGLLGDLE